MDTDSDTTNPSPRPPADSVPSKNRVYYSDSEWNSEPWTHITARNKKIQKTTTNSDSDHPMHTAGTNNSDVSSDTSFDKILCKLNHTAPHRTPTLTTTQTNYTIPSKHSPGTDQQCRYPRVRHYHGLPSPDRRSKAPSAPLTK